MKKKVMAILLCCALAAGVLTGCGRQQGGTTDGVESTGGTENTESVEGSEGSTEDTKGTEDTDDAETTEDLENMKDTESMENMESSVSEESPVIPEYEITMQDISPMELVKEMKIGWNLGNTLDAVGNQKGPETERVWGNPKTTQEMIDAVIDQGFNVIRIPVTWGSHMGEAPEYEVWPAWMDRVQEVVDYAYNRGVYVIINLHHEGWHFPSEENKEAASQQLMALWTAIATRFRDYDEHLIFEALNEPRKTGTSVEWNGGDKEGRDVVNDFNQVFVDAVRATGGNNTIRNLMVPGYAASSNDTALKGIVLPQDDHLIVSVHAYIPYDFALNTAGRSTWNNDTKDIDHLMELLDELFLSKGVPVIIGEFGALNKDNEEERAQWARYYVSKAREYGIPCIWWDNNAFNGDGENFGLLNRRRLTFPYPDLLKALIESAEG